MSVRVPLIDRASRRDFNGGVVENLVIFRHDGPFLATFSPCKWSIFHRYTTREGLPTSYTTTGVIPSLMRFKWS
jgi:hypothetical protein